MLKPEKAEKVIENAKESFQIFTGFIIGKSIDSLIIGILTFFILTVFQLKYSLLVAVIVGVTNMIPFFGPFIGAIPGVLLYLCIEPVDALIFAGIILAVQQFDGWILGPMILGDSTGVRPIWVIFGITVGGAYFGFAGLELLVILSVFDSIRLFSNTGSINGSMSACVPHLAEPYSSLCLNFFAFFPFMYTANLSTAPTAIPTKRSVG